VYQDGRSGGWLVLRAPGLDRDSIDAAEAVIEEAGASDVAGREPMPDGRTREEHYRAAHPDGEDEGVPELDEARALLANLARFAEYLAAAVADHPRAQAWALASVFQQCAEEYQNEQAEKAADTIATLRFTLSFPLEYRLN
jgi:hypothetical protein